MNRVQFTAGLVAVALVAGPGLSGCSKPKGEEAAAPAASGAQALTAEAGPGGKRMKAGLWEMSTQMAGLSINGLKVCLDENMTEDMGMKTEHINRETCSKFDVHRTSAGANIDLVCEQDGRTVTGKISFAIQSDTAFHQVVNITDESGQAFTVTSDGKWVSACPADMKPGDTQAPGGMHMNMGGR